MSNNYNYSISNISKLTASNWCREVNQFSSSRLSVCVHMDTWINTRVIVVPSGWSERSTSVVIDGRHTASSSSSSSAAAAAVVIAASSVLAMRTRCLGGRHGILFISVHIHTHTYHPFTYTNTSTQTDNYSPNDTTPAVKKKQDIKLFFIYHQIVMDFYHCYTRQEICNKRSLQIPAHLKGVTTRPSEILVFKNCTEWKHSNGVQAFTHRTEYDHSRWAGTKPIRPATNSLFNTLNSTIWCRSDHFFTTTFVWSV